MQNHVPGRVSWRVDDLELRLSEAERLTILELSLGWVQLTAQPQHGGLNRKVVEHLPVGGMQICGRVGVVPNHAQTLDVVEVRVGQENGRDLTGTRLDRRNHVERRGARIHDHALGGGFAPRDVAVLDKVTAREASYFHPGSFHFPQNKKPVGISPTSFP